MRACMLCCSSLVRFIEPVALNADGAPANDPSAAAKGELRELSDSLQDTQPAGALVAKCRTLDQVRAVQA